MPAALPESSASAFSRHLVRAAPAAAAPTLTYRGHNGPAHLKVPACVSHLYHSCFYCLRFSLHCTTVIIDKLMLLSGSPWALGISLGPQDFPWPSGFLLALGKSLGPRDFPWPSGSPSALRISLGPQDFPWPSGLVLALRISLSFRDFPWPSGFPSGFALRNLPCFRKFVGFRGCITH